MRIFILCLAVAAAAAFEPRSRGGGCENVECRAGRECVEVGGAPHCQCIATCPDHLAPVCGTDTNSYDNHCLLHRHACLTESKISVQHKGYCKKKKTITEKKPLKKVEKEEEPAVCYSSQRDAFLVVLAQHWRDTVGSQPWHVPNMTYRESLWGRFFTCDTDRDNFLDADELLNCTSTTTFFARPEQDQELTRALCVDALVDVADSNRDWRLDFEEFTTVMSPGFHPPQKTCSLEGQNYRDGEDVHVDDNHCVCAVGSWVCTSPKATSNDKTSHIQRFDYLDDYSINDIEEFYDDDDDYDEDEDDDDDDDDDDYEEVTHNNLENNNDSFQDDSFDDEYDYLADEQEDKEYLDKLLDELLEKLRKHRKQHHHHNKL